TISPEGSFDKVEQVMYEELERLVRDPVSEAELHRAKSANRKGTILANADPMSFANLLCQAEASADWKWAVEYDDKFDAVSPADIMRVARTYFNEDNRTVGRFIPTEKELASTPSMVASAAEGTSVVRKKKTAKSSPKPKLERIELARPKPRRL